MAALCVCVAVAFAGSCKSGKSGKSGKSEKSEKKPVGGQEAAQSFEGLLATVTAAVAYTDDSVLLIAGEKGYRYRPSDWSIIGEVALPLAPDAALRWDAEHAILFKGDKITRVQLESMKVVEELSFADFNLPPDWTFIDAAAAKDDSSWILFRGDEALLYDEDTGLVTGPLAVDEFGPRDAWPLDGFTAAFGTFDERVVALGTDRVIELDLETFDYKIYPVGTRALLPDFGGLPAPLGRGLTAATSISHGIFMLTRESRAVIYSLWAGSGSEPVELGVAPDAAVRWNDSTVMFFVGAEAVHYDIDKSELVGRTSLAELGLPAEWTRVDAVAVADLAGRQWMVFRDDSYGFLTLPTPSTPGRFEGPRTLASLGLPADQARVDAATELLDGDIVVVAGNSFRIIDLAAQTLSRKHALAGFGPSPSSSPLRSQ